MTLPSATDVGPSDTDPLTDEELSILLAVPRAAQATPDATLFRLPRGLDPTLGWVDVTCAQVKSIVSRLAYRWSVTLSDIMHKRSGGKTSSVGPGTIVCILVEPAVDALFHHLTLWSLGCTVQYTMLSLGEHIVSSCLRQSGCHIALCSEQGSRSLDFLKQLGIEVAVLQESERALNLALEEINLPANHNPPWPDPRRPSPALIIHSSASTGDPKVMRFSLHYYTIGLAWSCQQYLASRPRNPPKSQPVKGPFTHPRLMFNPPYWQSFYASFIVHLVTATPIAFPYASEVGELSGSEIAAWVECLQVGGLAAYTPLVRDVILLGTHTELLQSLYHISFAGSRADQHILELCVHQGLSVTNVFGSSELDRLLFAPRAPYSHLRPFPDAPHPLVVPISDTKLLSTNSQLGDLLSREVQLWSSLSTSPRLAHLVARGGVPLKLEPYPGEGPCHGDLAVNWGDIFREIRVPKPSAEGETELVYIHLGRADDHIRISSYGDDLNASEFEAELRSLLEPRLAGLGDWRLDTLQVFGSNLPRTALVVQLRGEKIPDEALLHSLREGVKSANVKLNLTGPLKVDPYRRMLVVTRDANGSISHGVSYAGAGVINASKWGSLWLLQTHKHTLRRWRNVKAVEPWLDGLDWN